MTNPHGSWAMNVDSPLIFRVRRLVKLCGWGLLCGLGLFCSWGCQAETLQFEVASCSMAPTLPGPSRQAYCAACSHTRLVAVDCYQPGWPTRCDQCGGLCSVSQTVQPGTVATVRRKTQTLDCQRWDVIAFRAQPSEATQVKRVWGMPGERLRLLHGDVYLSTQNNDQWQLLQKSLAELRCMSIPVSHFPQDRLSHWQLRFAQSSDVARPMWIEQLSTRSAPSLKLLPEQQLLWRRWRPARVHPSEVPAEQWLQPGPIVDDYAVNQADSRQMQAVRDYLLLVVLQQPLTGELTIDFQIPSGPVGLKFTPARKKKSPDQTSTASGTSLGPFMASQRMAIAWCDQRLLIETDVEQHTFAGLASQPALPGPPESSTEPWIRITTTSEVQLAELRIDRDLHFEDWEESSTPTQGYFLMGDNLPMSDDSRRGLGRVPAEHILGLVER